ncbi:MAG TPA: thiamine diphosphokinase [Melioribacteraceae bacterium]|nr:thiamine diphosphokinase [Melioribacteraceae bacterium]
MKKKAIIIANGYKPQKSKIKKIKKFNFNDIICADGGSNNLIKTGFIPLYIIGDLDSVEFDTIEYFKLNKTKIIKIEDQENTDIEKVLDFLINENYLEVIVFGGTGNRLDHTIGNISVLIKYCEKIKIHLLHYNSVLTCINKNIKLKTCKNEVISFYGIYPDTLFKTEGLKYNLDNENLYLGFRESTSNEANSEVVNISSNNKFLLIRNFDSACENDYFK